MCVFYCADKTFFSETSPIINTFYFGLETKNQQLKLKKRSWIPLKNYTTIIKNKQKIIMVIKILFEKERKRREETKKLSLTGDL